MTVLVVDIDSKIRSTTYTVQQQNKYNEDGDERLRPQRMFNSPNFRTVILTITLLLLYFHNLEL
jgi:hypothetical protein